MANGLALERCPLWGKDPSHEEDCWRVTKRRVMDIATHEYPVVADHVTYEQGMMIVLGLSEEDTARLTEKIERGDGWYYERRAVSE